MGTYLAAPVGGRKPARAHVDLERRDDELGHGEVCVTRFAHVPDKGRITDGEPLSVRNKTTDSPSLIVKSRAQSASGWALGPSTRTNIPKEFAGINYAEKY